MIEERRVENRFNRGTPKIKQIFCKHKYEWGREWNGRDFCIYHKCKKCGFFKIISYYKG